MFVKSNGVLVFQNIFCLGEKLKVIQKNSLQIGNQETWRFYSCFSCTQNVCSQMGFCLKLGSPRIKPEKSICRQIVYQRGSQEALLGAWGSVIGKGRKTTEGALLSRLLPCANGVNPAEEFWQTVQNTPWSLFYQAGKEAGVCIHQLLSLLKSCSWGEFTPQRSQQSEKACKQTIAGASSWKPCDYCTQERGLQRRHRQATDSLCYRFFTSVVSFLTCNVVMVLLSVPTFQLM